MCGINGIFSLKGKLPGNARELVQDMNACISHRGPDDTGIYKNPADTLIMGHQRLSIIDLSSAGHQPMLNESGDAIVFNGEIYNYKELKQHLKNYNFKSDSDTEVLLELCRRHGIQSLPELNGMFAFAYWNQKEENLLLAKDHAGKKPLYYSMEGGYFSFSSEIKALLKLPWIKTEYDPEALYHFLTFNQLSAPQTMFKGIVKMHPGSAIKISSSSFEETTWHQLTLTDYRNSGIHELENKIRKTLHSSTGYRMVADVPVGAFLSGGVDSSAVLAMMREYTKGSIHTYSVGFKNQPAYDERKYADEISKRYKTNHTEIEVSSEDIAEFLPKIAGIFDEPLADSTCIPIYFISKAAREQNTIVVQTGDGADEIFAGYRSWMRYRKYYPWFHAYMKLPHALKKSIAGIFDAGQNESVLSEMLSRASSGEDFFQGGARAFREYNKQAVLTPGFMKNIHGASSYEIIRKQRSNFLQLKEKYPWLDDTSWMCYLGYSQQIPWKYCYRMDKLGMANSIEIRSPFLDKNMVELALSIPSHKKLHGNEPKGILKSALKPVLPEHILYRKKMGFNVPVKSWASEIMYNHIDKNLETFCSETGIFNAGALRIQLEEMKNGNKGYINNLWTIYFLMIWFNRWMK